MDLLVNRTPYTDGYGDLVFQNGECPVTQDVASAVAQKVFIMLRTFQGEWYLNERVGIPYVQQILGHKVSKARVDRILQEKILAEEGVADITSYTSTVSGTRVYEARFTLRTINGQTVSDVFSMEI